MNDPKSGSGGGGGMKFSSSHEGLTIPSIYGDAIHRICHDIIMHAEDRAEKSSDLMYFTNSIERNNYIRFGRGACLVGMAGILVNISAVEENDIDEDDEDDNDGDNDGKQHHVKPILQYEPKDWDRILQRLEHLRNKIIRMDATVSFHPVIRGFQDDVNANVDDELDDDNDGSDHGSDDNNNDDDANDENRVLENDQVNQDMEADCLFQDQYHQVLQQCQFLQAMSYIRPTIQEAIRRVRRVQKVTTAQGKKMAHRRRHRRQSHRIQKRKRSGLDRLTSGSGSEAESESKAGSEPESESESEELEHVHVDDDHMSAMYTFIKQNFQEEDKYHDYLLSFFQSSKESGKIDLTLKPLSDVLGLLHSRKDLKIGYCLKKVEQLLQNWYMRLYHPPTPPIAVSDSPALNMNMVTTSTLMSGLRPEVRVGVGEEVRPTRVGRGQPESTNRNVRNRKLSDEEEEEEEGDHEFDEEEQEEDRFSIQNEEEEDQADDDGSSSDRTVAMEMNEDFVANDEDDDVRMEESDRGEIVSQDGKNMNEDEDADEDEDEDEDEEQSHKETAGEEDATDQEESSPDQQLERDEEYHSAGDGSSSGSSIEDVDGLKQTRMSSREKIPTNFYHRQEFASINDRTSNKRKRKRTNFFSAEYGGNGSNKMEGGDEDEKVESDRDNDDDDNNQQGRRRFFLVGKTPPKTKLVPGKAVILEGENDLIGFDDRVVQSLQSPNPKSPHSKAAATTTTDEGSLWTGGSDTRSHLSSPLRSRPTLRSPPERANVKLRNISTPPMRKKRIRKDWSEDEINAIRVGIKKHGKGNWAKIKDEFSEELKDRTNIQIKDKWRVLELHGEKAPKERSPKLKKRSRMKR